MSMHDAPVSHIYMSRMGWRIVAGLRVQDLISERARTRSSGDADKPSIRV